MKTLALLEGWIIFALTCRLAHTATINEQNIWVWAACILGIVLSIASAYIISEEIAK